MSTLTIRKKSLKTWLHTDSILGNFIISKFYFNADNTSFQIVEQGQSKRVIYNINDITLYNEVDGGGAETFSTITELSLRLEELNYTAFQIDGQITSIANLIQSGTNVTIIGDGTLASPYIISSTGGSGGSQTLTQTLVLGNATDGEDILLSDGDAVLIDNGSKLKKGTTDAGLGGVKGIALKCSVDYELKWEAGRIYVMEQDGFTIREVSHNFAVIPAITDDITKGFVVGSRWLLDDGTLYTCSDNTTGVAVWDITVSGTPTLDEVLTQGSVASIVLTDGSTYDVNLPFDDGFDIYMGDSVTTADNNNQALRIMQYSLITNTINSENSTFQLTNQNLLQQLFPTSGDYNIIHSAIKTDGADTGGVQIQIPTPKTFSPNGQVNYKFPYKEVTGDYTLATIDQLPTNTSDLINDGDDGNPFISLLDLPSNIIFYPTNVASDIVGYVKIVTSITDPSYNTTAVDIPTGAITTTNQLISSLATSPNIIVGNPGVFNITTIGNIRRISGSGEASFYFKVYKRTSGGVETLIATSDNTIPVIDGGTYIEFSATAIWNDGIFLDTDRVVMKYYANRISGGSNPTYEFQFGGVTPVRTLVPIPLTVVPILTIDAIPTDGSTNAVSSNGVFDALALKANKYFTNSTTVSAVGTTETILFSQIIAANSKVVGDNFFVKSYFEKIGTAGAYLVKFRLSTDGTIANSVIIAIANPTSVNNWYPFIRNMLKFESGNILRTFLSTQNFANDDAALSVATSTHTYNLANNYYILVTAQNSNAADTTYLRNIIIQ